MLHERVVAGGALGDGLAEAAGALLRQAECAARGEETGYGMLALEEVAWVELLGDAEARALVLNDVLSTHLVSVINCCRGCWEEVKIPWCRCVEERVVLI
jgi:hypothetical protein